MAYKPPYEIVKAANADYTFTGDGLHKVRCSSRSKEKPSASFRFWNFTKEKFEISLISALIVSLHQKIDSL